jgi:hypothetical protein
VSQPCLTATHSKAENLPMFPLRRITNFFYYAIMCVALVFFAFALGNAAVVVADLTLNLAYGGSVDTLLGFLGFAAFVAVFAGIAKFCFDFVRMAP